MSHSNSSGAGNTPPSPLQTFMRFLRGGSSHNGSGSGAGSSLPGSPQQQSHQALQHPSSLGFGTPTAPQRSLSDPMGSPAMMSGSAGAHRPHSLSFSGSNAFGAGPVAAHWAPRPELHRARSLETAPMEHFRLGESAVPASAGGAGAGQSTPTQPFRSFSVTGGAPVAEAAARKKSNGFLELLASQDSFIGND